MRKKIYNVLVDNQTVAWGLLSFDEALNVQALWLDVCPGLSVQIQPDFVFLGDCNV